MRKKIIDENTAISLGLFVIMVGGICWISYVAFQGSANAESIKQINTKIESIQSIREDMAIIREKVENIERHLNRR